MPQWLAGELGYALAIVGFIVVVCEWFYVFNTQGNTLARDALRAMLGKWRRAADAHHSSADDQRRDWVRRMREVAARIKDAYQRTTYGEYVGQLEDIRPDETQRLDELDRAFEVGTAIEEERKRPRRRKLMIVGAFLVIVGSLGQMVSTAPEPFGPFCATKTFKEWKCP
jgi:hypothetical protein